MNVSVRGLIWAMLLRLDSAVHFTKSGREALRLLLHHNNQSVFIYGTPIWRMLLHRWEAASSQHDASEFLAFLLSKLCTPVVTWRWEARLATDTDCEVLDRGDSMQAITLEIPGEDGPYTLQSLLHSWHAQANVHALAGDAELLLFRLARYKQRAGGIVRNNRDITWTASVHVPVFITDQGRASVATEFVVQATIMCIMVLLLHVAITLLCCMPQMLISIVTTGLRRSDGLNPLQDDTSRQMCTCSCAGGYRQQGAAAEYAKGPSLRAVGLGPIGCFCIVSQR